MQMKIGQLAATGGNYGPYGQPGYSAVTDNKTLWDSLQNTGIAYDSVVNNETNQEVASGALSWGAGIGVLYYNSGTALNDGQVSYLVTAHLTFKDDTDPNNITEITPVNDFYFQQPTGTDIKFSTDADTYLSSLLGKYDLDKFVSVNKDGSETALSPDKDEDIDKLPSYAYGKLDQTKASSDTAPMELVVYFKQKSSEPTEPETTTKKVTETINYVFEDENGNPTNEVSRQSTSAELTFNGTIPAGSTGDHTWTPESGSFAAQTIASEDGYDLISALLSDETDELTTLADGTKQVKAISVDPSSADQVVTVIFKKKAAAPNKPTDQGSNPTSQPTNEPDDQPSTPPQPSQQQPNQPSQVPTPQTSAPAASNDQDVAPHGESENAKQTKFTKTAATTTTTRSKATTIVLSSKHNNEKNISSNITNTSANSNNSSTKAEELPQTGAKQNKLARIGLAFVSLAGLIGLAGTRNRKN